MAFGFDDVLAGLAVNLVSSAVWDVLSDPAYASDLETVERGSAAYGAAVERAVEALEPALAPVTHEDLPRVREFLDSDDVRQLVMQLYRTRVTDAPPATRTTIRAAMTNAWALRHPGTAPAVDIDQLLDALVTGCDAMLERAIRRNDLAAHDAMEARRDALLHERLDGVERQVEQVRLLLVQLVAGVSVFEAQLRAAVVQTYNRLNVAGPAAHARARLADVYVPPPFVIGTPGAETLYDRLIGDTFRVVLLGGPGTGKTTFAQMLCRDLALSVQGLSGGLRTAGLLLDLRSLTVEDLQTPDAALRPALDRVVTDRLQVPRDEAALEYLLTAGRIAVIFDGLDELSNADDRRSARAGVDRFAERYPLVPLIVTSRIVGYDDAPLDPLRYRHARFADYTDVQAEAFVRRWFIANLEDREAAAHEAEALLAATKHVPSLRESPLLLTLACVVYVRERRLPRSRSEMYRLATDLLLREWVSDRPHLQISSSGVRAYLDMLRHLAWWMLVTPERSAGVSQPVLERETYTYFHNIIAISSEAAIAAEEFFAFCHAQPWVFAEVGVRAGETLYHFTHRTFMEYLAARHVLDRRRDIPEMADFVLTLLAQGHSTVAATACHLCFAKDDDIRPALASELLGRASGSDETTRIEAVIAAADDPAT